MKKKEKKRKEKKEKKRNLIQLPQSLAPNDSDII